jgi:hypothetical protein
MQAGWRKPRSTFDASKGLLHNDHYHTSYVTNDIERAVQIFGDRYGIPGFRESDHHTQDGARARATPSPSARRRICMAASSTSSPTGPATGE